MVFISNPPPPPVPGSDYTSVTEFLKFSSYDTRDCVNIAIATDYLVENDEAFTVKLSSTDDDVTFGVSMGKVVILDDDYVDSKLQELWFMCTWPPHTHTTAATISLEQAKYIVHEGEGSVMVCAAITEGHLSGFVGVQLTTVEGTASKTTLCNSWFFNH